MPDHAPETAGRRQRADAQHNRARVLEAADAVFASDGISASTGEIARRAGVGIGTVFRHFPTKADLLEAVFVARIHRLAAEAGALAAAPDPGEAFFRFLRHWAEMSVTKNAFADALAGAGIDVKAKAQVQPQLGQELQAALGKLLDRAQQAGAVRPDVGVPELISLLVGTARAAEHADDPEVHARMLTVVFDGLRPPRQ